MLYEFYKLIKILVLAIISATHGVLVNFQFRLHSLYLASMVILIRSGYVTFRKEEELEAGLMTWQRD